MTSSPHSCISRLPDDYPPPPNLDITIRYTPANPLPPPPALRSLPSDPPPSPPSKERSVAFSDNPEYLPGTSESYPPAKPQTPPILASAEGFDPPELWSKIPDCSDKAVFWGRPVFLRAEGHLQALKDIRDMGLEYNTYLDSDRIFGCRNCKTHLATHENIISRNFRGQHGKAYLFSTVVNILSDEAVERNMTTGKHVVRDIRCKQCAACVGWKYDKAYEQTEKYKENKFILEAELLCQVF